jgi:CRP/FNR family cyclic AMP-dependent transcriptional regulator
MALRARRRFNLQALLGARSVKAQDADHAIGAVLFSQGDPASSVLYITRGRIKLSVVSGTGKEAVVGVLGAGEFVGEGALAGQPRRLATATAMILTRTLEVPKQQMIRLLHQHRSMSDRFITHMLARNLRLEQDLVDQLFNASEKRLARTLLLLARFGKPSPAGRVLPRVSQELLAEMVGTTRSRVNFFMNKFRKLGFIDYNGTLTVRDALMTVVLP